MKRMTILIIANIPKVLSDNNLLNEKGSQRNNLRLTCSLQFTSLRERPGHWLPLLWLLVVFSGRLNHEPLSHCHCISWLPASYLAPSLSLGLRVNSFAIIPMAFQGQVGEETEHRCSTALSFQQCMLSPKQWQEITWVRVPGIIHPSILPRNIGEHGPELTWLPHPLYFHTSLSVLHFFALVSSTYWSFMGLYSWLKYLYLGCTKGSIVVLVHHLLTQHWVHRKCNEHLNRT